MKDSCYQYPSTPHPTPTTIPRLAGDNPGPGDFDDLRGGRLGF